MAKEKKEKTINNSIDSTLAALNRQFGEGTIFEYNFEPEKLDVVSTGSLYLDIALGVGGLPKGRIVEIFGGESSGKTTISLTVTANCQKTGGKCAYIDTEHSLDPVYAKALGVNVNELIVSQPDSAEQALTIVEGLVRTNKISCIVIDSVAALVPQVELDGEYGQAHMGIMARLMSQAMRKLVGVVSGTNTLIIFTNQTRDKIGVMWGSPVTTTGGHALKFYSSIRLETARIGTLKDGEKTVGNRTRVTVKKNKVAPPFKIAEFDLIFGKGIDQLGEIIDMGTDKGIIDKSGAWYSYNSERLGQGRDNSKEYLELHPEIVKEILEKVRG